MSLFEIKDLEVSVAESKQILKKFCIKIEAGEVHAIMGKNGSGKSSLANTIMGNPFYQVKSGEILFEGASLLSLSPEERAKKRIFLSFQSPVSVPGVSVANFLRQSVRSVRGDELSSKELRKLIKEELTNLDIPESFMTRSLNDGFSGGEKKKLETLQLRLLQPKFAILDETDSGLDIDALKIISENIQSYRSSERGILMITHYQRMLKYIRPDFVHIMIDGRIVKSGGYELAEELEEKGYEGLAGEAA